MLNGLCMTHRSSILEEFHYFDSKKKIKQCVLSRRLQQHVLWHKYVKDTFYHCVYMIKASFQQKSLYPFWTLKELYLNAFMWFPELHLDPDRRSMYIIMNISFSFFRNVLYCRNVSYEYGRRGTVHFNNCPKKKKRKLKVTHKDARHVFWKTGVKSKTRSTVHSQVTDLNQTLVW